MLVQGMIPQEIYSSSKKFLLQVRFLKDIIGSITEPLLMVGVLKEMHNLKKTFLIQARFQGRAQLVQGVLVVRRPF